ncbi:hypothetical protein TTRE_0000944201 [Trichuris trichiura]|uniref:Uncharacterized protein n=1 Tax=Trichuris trichiura TaxID=36087 RepID=A0A077ZMQ5_TRITR|nr:hypothetical protein TTRE_0000944201 [Trichuris trichiura]
MATIGLSTALLAAEAVGGRRLARKSLTRATTVNGETRVLCAWLLCLHHADPVTAAAGGGDGRTAVPLDPSPLFLTTRPEQRTVGPADSERARCYPKDGELCMSRTKPEETLVEVRSGVDVQITRPTCA